MTRSLASLLVFISGFIALSYEILWIRVYNISVHSKAGYFGLVIGSYILGLALATLLLYKIQKKRELSVLLWVSYLFSASTLVAYMVIPAFAFFMGLFWYVQWLGLVFIFIAAFSFGILFPFISGSIKSEKDSSGKNFSTVYFFNIIGSSVGSMLTAFLLLDVLSLANVSLLIASTGIVCSFILFLIQKNKKGISFVLIVGISLFLFHGVLHKNVMAKFIFQARYKSVLPFRDIIENRHGVITVEKKKVVRQNGTYDAFIETSPVRPHSEILHAYLQYFLHPGAKDVLQIGLASGSWAQVIVNFPKLKKLTAIEINPAYPEIISLYKEVRSLLQNPKIEIIIDDGRHYLKKYPNKKYDLIVLNSTFHFKELATNLLSYEFMRLLKSHLNKGGVIYTNTTGSRSALLTVKSVFKYILISGIYVAASDSEFKFNAKQFAMMLKNMKIDNKSVFDFSKKYHKQYFNRLIKYHFSSFKSKKIDKKCRIIRDDNMTTEYKYFRSARKDCI